MNTLPADDAPVIDLLPYYVYELRDPRNNEVFYVGKGQENRMDQHQAGSSDETDDVDDAQTQLNKERRIKAIQEAGYPDCVRIIIARFKTEAEAFAVESMLIKWVYGFSNLTNRVHGHRHKNMREYAQKLNYELEREYPFILGIDRSKKLPGECTEGQRRQIADNAIVEKLDVLRDKLILQKSLQSLKISESDCSKPQDPCLIVSGFNAVVHLQIKFGLAGENVVLNLRPVGGKSDQKAAFRAALANLAEGYEIKNPNGSLYAPIHNFRTKSGGMPNGVPHTNINQIMKLIDETFARLSQSKAT